MRRLIVDTPVQEAALVLDLPEGDLEMTLGRHSESNIVLSGAGISRHHARLVQANGMLFIEDVGSSGGTFVNGEAIQAMTPLEENDVVTIGDNTLRIEDVASAADAADEIPVEPTLAEPIAATPAPQPLPQPAPVVAAPPPSPEVNNFLDEFKNATLLYEDSIMELTKQIHTDILERLNLTQGALDVKNDETMDRVSHVMDQILRERRHEIPSRIPLDTFRQALMDELIGYGPISPVLRSSRVSEIMINGPDHVFVESKGKIFESGIRFFSEQHLLSIIQRIVEPLGRHVDEASPMVDARLPDGSRVNAIIPPLALQGASVTIRKFSEKKLTTDDLIKFGSMTPEMAMFLEEAVRSRQNILVSGGTGSGKTTLLNVLSLFIPKGERVITVEDSAELKLDHPNLVSLEARPANIEGKGRITIRDLVINTLRMRPDRIIVGECRGAEALDMLQAMNTGHDGSLTTAHANNPRDALTRLENMVMMAGFDLPSKAIREQIASALDLIVQQTRLPDGSRKIIQISEVTGREGDVILLQDIFTFNQTGMDKDGKVQGYHSATGNIPFFVEELRQSGRLKLDMSVFVPKA
ncbi:MAG: Flp pilus assembly complex ATPase component TadA [Victivallales bacterium]|nr:Flp pilus assembly complex ATPase component TadA [Victivallales bacterium]